MAGMGRNAPLLRACGAIGLAGAVLPVLADIGSWFLAAGYDPVAHSISSLAVGRSSWLIDFGLWAVVLAVLAVAAGFRLWRTGARAWTGASLALVLLAAAVGTVARVNEYAGTENPGANIHLWAASGVGLFFAIASLLAVPGLRRGSAPLGAFSLAVGVAWVILCPVYWFWTDAWSGAVERLLAVLLLAWLGTMGRALRGAAARDAARS